MRKKWVLASAILSLFSIAVLYVASNSYFNTIEVQRAQNRVSLYRSTLLNALEKFQHLPFVLAQDPFVIKAAGGTGREQLNLRLEAFANQAELEAIYLLDPNGMTVAASNHDKDLTFLGQNYGFRPYFKQAMLGQRGRFFGIGATTSRPGYFLAEAVKNHVGRVVGVIALKLDLTTLQKTWSAGGEDVFVSNKDGIVILSSNSGWLYQTLSPLDDRLRARISSGRQFRNRPLAALAWRHRGEDKVKIDGTNYVHVTTALPDVEWMLHYLADESRVQERTWFAVITGGIILSFLLTTFMFFRSKRIRQALEDSQKARRLLSASNIKLENEIEERIATEMRLESTQSALAQASKMAVLGQLAASVTHELGQPISAMRNYLTAAEFDQDDSNQNHMIDRLGAIIKRMENITKQLRFFAKPGKVRREPVDLRRVLDGAHKLVIHDLDTHKVEMSINVPTEPVRVLGHRLRLEQVVLNLINNSIAAMEGIADRKIDITLISKETSAVLMVDDKGHGLGGQTIEQLKEPFHTTRASGQGLGLGLAITASIIDEHNGNMSAINLEGGGARFIVELPKVYKEERV